MKQLITEMKRKFENINIDESTDQNNDGKHDFTDVQIARKLASGEYVKCKECNGKGKGCDHCDKTGLHKKVDEMSTSAGVAPVTGKYFLKDKKQKKKMKYPGVAEAMEKRYERLIEGYRTYATSDPKKSPESKVNETIIEVSKKLREIEESVKNASRLKEESGVTREGYKKRTNKALDAISERLVKISERVRNLMQ
jgi:hypothetical protein